MLSWPNVFLYDNFKYPKITVKNNEKIKLLALRDAITGWQICKISIEKEEIPKGFDKGLQKIAKLLDISVTLLASDIIIETVKKYI